MRHALLLTTLGLGLSAIACQPPPPPSLEQILARAEAIEEPVFDTNRREEPGYLEIYEAARRGASQLRAAVLLDALRYHPEDARLPDLMNQRWGFLARSNDPATGSVGFLADIDAVLAETTHPDIARHGAYWRALVQARQARDEGDLLLAAGLGFVDAYPADQRGGALMEQVANHPSSSPDNVRVAWQRIADLYPRNYWGPYAPGQVRRVDEAGQTFQLRFETFRSGETVSSETLAGKVVVLDFWATTCVPCITALPEMRRLYSEYRDQGVEFVGVSLDESEKRGGRERLVSFLAEYDVPWPIYFQGNGYYSDLSFSWGVGGIPEVFLLDRDGRLVTTEARGRLAELIPELL